MKILIAGYSYIRENFLNTFNGYPEKNKIFFLLPNEWKAKGGKVIFLPPKRKNIFTTKTFFYHSNYPILGGLLKGWMPCLPFYLKGYDILYTSGEPVLLSTLYNVFWAKLFGKKHVFFTWENISYNNKFKGLKGLVKEIILKLNLFFSDAIICGNLKAGIIMKEYTNKPISVIPMSGVDTEFFKPSPTEKNFRGHDLRNRVVYSFIGSISYRKGIHLIIEAYKKVIDMIPDSSLIIAGSGEYEEEVERLIKESALDSHIIRVPWVSHQELVQLFSVSDIFLYPSFSYKGWEEQFGYSMAEASLMELPVISAMSGSIEDVVINGETGLLVKPGEVDGLAEAMLKLGSDEILRKKMGQAGREYILKNFTYRIVAGKFYEFFKKINLHS